MSKIFQIVDERCHWHTPFESVAEAQSIYPPDCEFIEAPDWVEEQWDYDRTKEGLDRFVHPEPPEGYIWDDDDHCMYSVDELPRLLQIAQLRKQNENKILFTNWLDTHPLTWVDGKQYGVTMEDQSEIQLNLSQYQVKIGAGIENATLQWHSIHESCQEWQYNDLMALVLAITDYIYPYFELMNQYKEQIFSCTDYHEVPKINLFYPDSLKEPDKEENPENPEIPVDPENPSTGEEATNPEQTPTTDESGEENNSETAE